MSWKQTGKDEILNAILKNEGERSKAQFDIIVTLQVCQNLDDDKIVQFI